MAQMARFSYSDEIKDRVPLSEAMTFYGLRLVMGRTQCPFHNGKDRNLSVKRDHFRCFVCGEHGDVITFVMRYFGLSFMDAMRKLNDDFNLRLPLDKKDQTVVFVPTPDQTEKQRKSQEHKKQLEELQKRYEEAFGAYAACDVIVMRCKPVSAVGVAGISEAYAWALKNIDRCWHELKEAEAELFSFEMDEE